MKPSKHVFLVKLSCIAQFGLCQVSFAAIRSTRSWNFANCFLGPAMELLEVEKVQSRSVCQLAAMADEFQDEISMEAWVRVAPELRLTQVEHLERDGVTIQCVNSSDFVVGKQTNFNGPVTIITWPDPLKMEGGEGESNEKKLVIKKKVLSRSAAMEVQKMAAEKRKSEGGDQNQRKLKKSTLKISALILAGLLTIAVVASSIVLTEAPAVESPLKCTPLMQKACIYSEFAWGGRLHTSAVKPLEKPVPYVVISQTHGGHCYEVDRCLKDVEFFQGGEVACNFLLGGDGNVYEDRGWDKENSLQPPASGRALLICFMGNYTEEEYPTYPQVSVAKGLIRLGVDDKHVSEDYVLTASNASSPQDTLGSIYNIIKKWKNFQENPFSSKLS